MERWRFKWVSATREIDYTSASNLLTLRAMAGSNGWANHRLLSACAGSSQAEFEGDALLRANEFAELGWTEAEIWREQVSDSD